MRPFGFRVCLLFYLICPANIIGLWWAVGSPLLMDPNRICRKSRKVGNKQREICRDEPDIVVEAVKGATSAITECGHQFRDRAWNCPTKHRGIKKVLRLDTREAAFVNAITSAGVVWSVTHACTMGSLIQCSCASPFGKSQGNQIRKSTGQFEWGGCGDDVTFGLRKSKEFMDVRRRKKKRMDLKKKTNLHNNKAGRLTVKRNMRLLCKCHGLSGSCTLKTCWQKMPTLRVIGDKLKDKFDGASQVIISNDAKRLLPVGEKVKPPDTVDLVYSTDSPSYCDFDKKSGSLGTVGRRCDPSSMGVGGCDLLCCARDYTTHYEQVTENCKCRFVWCCDVKCQTCTRNVQISTCL